MRHGVLRLNKRASPCGGLVLRPRWHSHSHGGKDGAGHSHSHGGIDDVRKEAGERGTRITLIAMGANVGLTIAKGTAGVMCNSVALIADAAHALSDLVADVITLAALKVARKPPSEEFPWGYGRLETLGTLSVGSLLLVGSLGVGWHSYEVLAQLLTESSSSGVAHAHSHGLIDLGASGPPRLDPAAIWIALGSIAVKEALYRKTIQIGQETRSSVLIANAWHHRSDAWSSVVALVGIGGAISGFPALDPIGGIIVSGMILQQGAVLTYDSMKELIDANVDRQLADQVRDTASTFLAENKQGGIGKHVSEVTQIRGRKMGHYTLVDMYITVHPRLSVSAAHQIVEHVRHEVLTKHSMVTELMIHIIPAGHRISSALDGSSPVHVELLRPQGEIEQDVLNLLSSNAQVTGVSHITVHYVDGKCMVQAEIQVDPDQTVRQAQDISKQVVEQLKTISGVDAADVHLELNEDHVI